MRIKIFPISLIIIVSVIFIIFYKGLQNSNVYEPQIGNQKNIPVFIAKAFETDEIFKSEDKLLETAGQITGAKPITVDVAESLGYNMIGFKKRIADARKLRRTDLDQANKSLREIEQEIYELTQDALALGVDMKDIKKKMMDWGGIGEERSRFILTNRYYPLTPVKD